jgi:release factor glutamine methyltransferase
MVPLPGVFRPPSDAVMLAEKIREERLPLGSCALDLCTGSGYLAIVAAQHGATKVVATDISRRALIAARLNARLNGVRVDALHGDLFEPVSEERFHLIVSNPPYVPSVDDELPRTGLVRAWEAGPNGRAFLDRICAEAPGHLRPGGVLLLVHSSICSEEKTLAALSAHGLGARTVARARGALGPIMRPRAQMLRARGLLGADELEEIVVIRAEAK